MKIQYYHNKNDNTIYSEKRVIVRELGRIPSNYRKMTEIEINEYLRKIRR